MALDHVEHSGAKPGLIPVSFERQALDGFGWQAGICVVLGDVLVELACVWRECGASTEFKFAQQHVERRTPFGRSVLRGGGYEIALIAEKIQREAIPMLVRAPRSAG